MNIKIISDGQGATTKIVDTDTGAILKNVISARWECKTGGLAHCVLELVNVPVEITGEVKNKIKKEKK